MPNQKTLRDVLPVVWTKLELTSLSTEAHLKKSVYRRWMEETGTVVTPRIINRLWLELSKSKYARPSPYFDDVLDLNVSAIYNMLIDSGLSSVANGNANSRGNGGYPLAGTHTEHTRCYESGPERIRRFQTMASSDSPGIPLEAMTRTAFLEQCGWRWLPASWYP